MCGTPCFSAASAAVPLRDPGPATACIFSASGTGPAFGFGPLHFLCPGGKLVDPAAEALPAGGIAHPAHGPGEALSVCEVVVHGSLPHLQGELGLPLPLRGPDLPMLQIVLVPGPERMPRRVPQLRNRVCVAMIESDEGLDCDPSLFGAEHAASFLSRFLVQVHHRSPFVAKVARR